MKLYAPSFYPEFRCIADRCRHSCCMGWEIGVDEESALRYRSLPGPVGDRLRLAMQQDADGVTLRLDERERCPMLNENGLCDLITACGEDALCRICAEHPRFYHDWAFASEVGLGLCCEEAVRLLLEHPGPFELIPVDEDGLPEEEDREELALYRLRGLLMTNAQQGGGPFSERLRGFLPEKVPAVPVGFWLSLEIMDGAWTDLLHRLENEAPDEAALAAREQDPRWGRVLAYLLFRHLPHALESGSVTLEVTLCACMLRLARCLCALPGTDMKEVIRMMSAELEYSDENLDRMRELLGGNETC